MSFGLLRVNALTVRAQYSVELAFYVNFLLLLIQV